MAKADQIRSRPAWRPLILGGAALALGAIATGLAFAGWSTHGASMLYALAASGLAWCM